MAFTDDDIAELYQDEVGRRPVKPVTLAAQSFGSQDGESNAARFATEHRSTAGDGFLYDDEGRTGRWSNEMRAHFTAALERLFLEGHSIRSIARTLGISRITVRAYRQTLRPSVSTCECGQPLTHQGWCRTRFLRSSRRQDFMRRWHPRGDWPLVLKDLFVVAWNEQVSEALESQTHQESGKELKDVSAARPDGCIRPRAQGIARQAQRQDRVCIRRGSKDVRDSVGV